MLQILRHRLATRSVTTRYPDVPDETPPAFRGMPDLLEDTCRGAGECAAICPTAAIMVRHDGEHGWTWRLDRAACTGCGLCLEACPYQALKASREFELASRSRADLVVDVTFRAAVGGDGERP